MLQDSDTMEDLMERCYREGQEFEIYITISATTTRQTFTLDTSNWDWNGDGVAETTPFKDKMFIITGMKLEITYNSSFTFQDVLFDGIEATPLDWYGYVAGGSIVLGWDGVQKGATAFKFPKITDHFGVPIAARHSIAIKASTCGGSDSALVRIRGFCLPKRQY